MPKVIEVKQENGCKVCPFFVPACGEPYRPQFCNAIKEELNYEYEDRKPNWCPLNNGDILVHLERPF